MNLFKVDKNIWSHPNKPYIYHIENIANSFDDKAHKISANFHDIGKLSKEFQEYIRKETKEKTTHAIEGGYLFTFLTKSIDKDFLSIFFSIVKHHGSLLNIKDELYRYSNINEHSFDKESWNKKLAVIEKNLGVESEYEAEEFHKLMRMFVDNFENFSTIEQFFLFKKRYSRLILADKFEAIFNQPYQSIDYLNKDKINTYIKNMHNLIATKTKNNFRNSAKETVFKNYRQNKNSHIYLIKAPTGVGKTFIALELALTIAKDKGDKRRVITTIPFTSIIDQTHSEYEKILGNVLKYHHLTKYKKDDDETEQFNQKVFLSDIWHEHFIVTTFNQLLNTIFSNHNRDNIRLETLRDSIVIIDEIQNIPRVLIRDIVKVFELFAKEYNIHFIIMSATMPSFEGLLENSAILSEDWFYKEKKNRYRLYFKEGINSFETLAQEISSHNKSVLCVVNTIEKAKKLFDELGGEERVNKFLLTTHQIPLHRQEIIEEIKKALLNGKKIKLVATQLIEAGVDLDFDIGYREFAPFSSIIQMAGRVNREGIKGVSDVFVFDFLEIEGKSKELKKLPYSPIDLQDDNTLSWLKTPLEEIEILENLDKYFKKIKDETSNVSLLELMKKLEFDSLKKRLDENFMPKQPWKVSLFIEMKHNQFNDFIKDREEIFKKYENKFDAMNYIKELEKDLGLYTITVNYKLIEELSLKYPIKEAFGRFILEYNSSVYTKYRGFDPTYTEIEEMFEL